ncbi:MAG: mechanosensitive ion channel protein MscS [Halioglobus sp.]|nr:mechanosensitive ion channel protein MscS [Halioglobus sp.]
MAGRRWLDWPPQRAGHRPGAAAPRAVRRLFALYCLAALPLLAAGPAQAQGDDGAPREPVTQPAKTAPAAAEANTSAREVLEKEKAAEELLRQRATAGNGELDAGRTPLTAMLSLRRAFNAGDYSRAAQFLDMRYLPEDMGDMTPEQLVRALAFMLNRQIILDLASLSDNPEGHTDDGLPAYRDRLAVLNLEQGEVAIYLQHVPDGKGGQTWKISNSTVQRIPAMWEELGFHPLASYLFDVLPDFTFMGMLNWQVLGLALALLLAWLGATLLTWLMNRLVQLIPNIFPQGIEHFFRRPLRIFGFIMLAAMLIGELGLSLKLRVLLDSSGLDYLAWTILLTGLISLLRDYHIRRLQALGQHNYAALLRPVSNMAKVLLVIVIALVWADNAGYSMTTILTGLGVGSLAVALAAQKTLENLIGAITLYSARPISPGDTCRFGGVFGTVEEIGLRSTAIRTLDRTLVHVPNAVLSSVEIENFSARDRFRYFRNARVLAQTPDQLRVILAQIRRTLLSHPMVHPDTVSVRLDDIEDVAARLRLDAGIRTTDFQAYLAVAEDLNLRFIEIIAAAGASLVGQGQLRLVREGGAAAATPQVGDMLALWREQDSAPFPDFSEREKAELRDSLDYPRAT